MSVKNYRHSICTAFTDIYSRHLRTELVLQVMKHILLLAFLLMVSGIYAQETIYGTIDHQDEERDYILYVPASYDASKPYPLVFCFHGYGGTAQANFTYTQLTSIADTANFILVHPQGAIHDNSTHWNVDGWIDNSPYDDVDFVSTLMDKLISEYSINEDRMYACGMSNGGYFSFLLACQLSERIAAIASITGAMSPQNFNECSPEHPIPVLQIHGTADDVVPYGGAFWTKSIAQVMTFWNTYDDCQLELIKEDIPNTSTTDNSTVEKYVYTDCANGISNEHFKVINGGHDWPGVWGNMDVNASQEIWRFFSQYDINGKIEVSSSQDSPGSSGITLFPNPTYDQVTVQLLDESPVKYKLYSTKGELLMTGEVSSGNPSISLFGFNPNIYMLEVNGEFLRIVINK